ncbi:Trk system potassium transport protein TrkA [Spirochaetia bacterium]|nr:Trk system potassium transport protein TrkA [Spirochaetia bacterium]
MRIIIVGAGMVGTQLAKHLIQEKHDVSIIESNEERARHASNRLDCLVIHDAGNSIKALEEAGIARADALVCVTDSDEVNMIICGLAASRYGRTNKPGEPGLLKIARVRNDDYMHLSQAGDKQVLGIDRFIHPNMEAARSIVKAIEHGAMGDIVSFSNTHYELGSIDVEQGSAFDGLVLKDYRNLVTVESLVTLVERDDEVLLPSGATVLAKGDRVYILADGKNLPEIFRFAGGTEKPIRKIGIVGGGRIGALIAEGLIHKDKFSDEYEENEHNRKKRNFLFPLLKTLIPRSSRRIVIIEQDYRLCKDLAARFPEALVLNEDISDESFVNEEQLDDLDLLVTTTNNQELNIITAVYFKLRGIARTIAMVTSSGYATMARQLGVDVVIPMKSVVVDSILSHLMGSGVKEVHRIGDGDVDIIEVEIGKDVPVIDKPIAEFKLSAGGLLMLVNRGGNSFIPKGDYVFSQGDHIVLIAKTGSQAEIEKYFGAAV